QVPEQHVKTDVDAGLMDDGHVEGEIARTLQRAAYQAPGERWESGEPALDMLVEQGNAQRLQHAPASGLRQCWPNLLPLPGAEQIAFAEEFGTETAVDPDPAEEQALQHQQTDPVIHGRRAVGVPATPRDADRPGHALLDCPRTFGWADRLGQIGVFP